MHTLVLDMTNTGERINYLSVALQARSAIKRLKMLLDGDAQSPELKSALKAALDSLAAVKPPEGLYSKLHDEHSTRFEEIQTVDEVASLLNDEEVKKGLENILRNEKYGREDVRVAMNFFSAVENRALYHYDDPSLAGPPND